MSALDHYRLEARRWLEQQAPTYGWAARIGLSEAEGI